MTVLIAVNTRDAIVMATDSQGTLTRSLIDPHDLSQYFENDSGRRMKIDSEGQPVLDAWSLVANQTIELPYKTHSEVEKIFSLAPLEIGVMVSGISSIGDRTVKSLIAEFKTTSAFTELCLEDHSLENTAKELLDIIWLKYSERYKSNGPELELMVCGYDKDRFTPGIVRVRVHENHISEPDYDFGIYFGGVTREIQRLLFGIDAAGKANLISRSNEVLEKYKGYLEGYLSDKGIDIDLPAPESYGRDLSLFHNLDLATLRMNCAVYSEQDAVDCADFLVNVMIKSQKFSDQFPTTGGTAQIAIVKKHRPLQFVSDRPSYLD